MANIHVNLSTSDFNKAAMQKVYSACFKAETIESIFAKLQTEFRKVYLFGNTITLAHGFEELEIVFS